MSDSDEWSAGHCAVPGGGVTPAFYKLNWSCGFYLAYDILLVDFLFHSNRIQFKSANMERSECKTDFCDGFLLAD